MKRTILLVLVLALGLATGVAKADFTFGTPTNMGPTVNSSAGDYEPSLSADGLSLFFESGRRGGSGHDDLWVTTRETRDDDWGSPVNLGPPVNSPAHEGYPRISADGLTLYFGSTRPGGFGDWDLWVTTRVTKEHEWSTPMNLGPNVNSSAYERGLAISAEGLVLFLGSDRPGGYGSWDLWVTTRATTNDDWGQPANLGPAVNSSSADAWPYISADGLLLFFGSDRPGGSGGRDIYVAIRETIDDEWGTPVNLGPMVNTSSIESGLVLSAGGSTLYFNSNRPGGFGARDLWEVPIMPVVDLNGDGIVDCADMCIMVDHWGEYYPLCDIGPTPLGDGIVDVQDLIVLAEHLTMEVDVDANDAGSQVELEQGQILVITLESNPTTGYRWEQVENQESILQQMGEAEFKPSETGEPPLVGAGGWEIFRFKAISAGQMTLQLVYHRPWEEGVEPLKTFSLQVVVR